MTSDDYVRYNLEGEEREQVPFFGSREGGNL